MQAIRNRLLHIEDEFISSLENNPSADFTFFESKIRDDVRLTISSDYANDEILELANAIITRSSLVAHRLSLLDQKGQELTESLHNDVEGIFNPDKPSHDSTPITLIGSLSLPPYIAPAYQWLMGNLHCPYPSVAKKDSLAKLSGTGRKAIDAWFIDVRKRIGWSSLRKLRYSGKKKEIIRDATDFFQEHKHVDNALEFASIHGAAKELYAGKLGHSVLATHIGAFVDRKKGSPSTSQSSVTSEGSSPPPDDRYNPRTLHPPRCASTTRTSLSKRSRSLEGREELEHDSRTSKRQRVHPRPTHNPVAHCYTARPSNFEQKSSSTDRVQSVSPEERIDSRCTDNDVVPPAETSTSTSTISTFSSRQLPASESSCRPPCDTQSKASITPLVSESLVTQTLETPLEWSFTSELSHLITPSSTLGDVAAYDVEAFDFGSFDFGDPLQMSQIVGSDSLEPIPLYLSSTTGNVHVNPNNDSSQGFVGMSDFSLNDPSPTPFDLGGLNLPATLNGLTQPPELDIPNHKSSSLVETDQSASWNFGGMDNLFRHILQTPPMSSTIPQSSILREEKKKKLQQLAEMRLAQQRLEAEIATLDSQCS